MHSLIEGQPKQHVLIKFIRNLIECKKLEVLEINEIQRNILLFISKILL